MSGDDDVRIARRLAPHPSPEHWLGLCVKVVPAATREEADAVVRTPEHYLAAAWPPAASGWTRWPEAVVIGSPTSARALETLFAHLPKDAKLHLAGVDDVEAALAAEILLVTDRNLEAYQRDAVANFAAAARERTRAAIVARYSDRDPGFERFRASVVGSDPARH